ncbi:ATP-dependent nuclease [Bacillus toyonensis]|uniref:ATP-dependent endonuclease n=1 Tax=Bacillus toyonensis TaxID=155322 RepID=A0A2C4QET8_9BACI|nr:AAA family ATPase [Bacillus toyonensis]PGB02042.1 ATP-dependent endonuclease [Bacillus toyonensis]PHD63349.1 ATP-dependent endonuclease [Bacillus toyonensis]
MYISELTINNFRSFNKKTTLNFNDGINVIIGQNNAGKTTVIKALDILFNNSSSKRLNINDFNRSASISELKVCPPKIYISAKLKESENEDEYSDELVTVATWLTTLNTPYEATITYEYFLPEKEVDEYRNLMDNISTKDINKYWKAIEHNFLKKYVHRIYVGNPEFKNSVHNDEINRFDFQFLTAIRDVERDLFKGNNSLLREVIDFFMDYDIKSDSDLEKKEKIEKIQKKKRDFSNESKKIIESLQQRMKNGEEQILKYVHNTGAGIDESKPSFDGEILDTELYSALRLIVEKKSGIKLPAISNGLGYNNLIYISLLLSKMQKDASGDYLGSNAKVFSILAIEEPEAHLHPSMQYKFLQFLKENKDSDVNQIFITSHSPNITAAVDLEDILVIQKINEEIKIAYPSKVFNDSDEEDVISRNYVKRFLDVTKADLFFAQNVILVEGIAEQLVIPEFANSMNLNLADSHTTVLNIGGRYFNHFLKLFDTNRCEFALTKKVACITDLDPLRKSTNDADEDNNWKKCLPIFLDLQPEKYEYKQTSNSLVGTYNQYDSKIKVFTQSYGQSSTFEYDLVLKNPTCTKLITPSVSNAQELKDLMSLVTKNKPMKEIVERIRKNVFKDELSDLLALGLLKDSLSIKKGIIASRYLLSISKGEAAQEIVYIISTADQGSIEPPDYISEAIKWICQ